MSDLQLATANENALTMQYSETGSQYMCNLYSHVQCRKKCGFTMGIFPSLCDKVVPRFVREILCGTVKCTLYIYIYTFLGLPA